MYYDIANEPITAIFVIKQKLEFPSCKGLTQLMLNGTAQNFSSLIDPCWDNFLLFPATSCLLHPSVAMTDSVCSGDSMQLTRKVGIFEQIIRVIQ